MVLKIRSLKVGILILFVSFLCSPVLGQKRYIQGQVTTFDSIPLINASVIVKSSKQEVKTDSMGFFYVDCEEKDKLRVSAYGFISSTAKVVSTTKLALINLTLKEGDKWRDLAVGYGHVRDKEKLFAVSSLKEEDFDYSRFSTLADAIRGRFPGVTISGNCVIVRGKESFGASNCALVVIDGIAKGSSIAGISPYYVARISFLKDASAAAYGSQGANGVVLIETKRGVDSE